MKRKKLAVFASGTGTLLEAIARHHVVDLVIADRHCRAIDTVAKRLHLPNVLHNRSNFNFGSGFDRNRYTCVLRDTLDRHEITLVAMAGFMTILDPIIFACGYKDRVLNTHPSLLPAFKGGSAVKDALEYGVRWTGCTVHVATEKLDEGRILAQEPVRVMKGDTVERLHERIKRIERIVYPRTIEHYLRTL